MEFVNLHTHTMYSVGDGLSNPDELAARVAELGQSAFAITDHGTVSGLMHARKAAAKQGLKLIYGSEFYFTPDVTVKERSLMYHICVWAKNNTGYQNLLKLTTLASQNFYYKPRIDWEILHKYADGLIVSAACMGGLIRDEKLINLFQLQFQDDFYLTLHTNTIHKQRWVNRKAAILAKRKHIKLLAEVDSHYVLKEDAPYQRAWNVMGDDAEAYATDDYYIMGGKEVAERLSYLPADLVAEAIANTAAVAEACNVEIDFSHKHYPIFPAEDPLKFLMKLCDDGFNEKIYGRADEQIYRERMFHELQILTQADYINYFLIAWDILRECRERGIYTDAGRGSVGGSLVAYLLGITKIDPIEHNLLFERFCHLERVTAPDVDIDVPQSRRQEVIQYIQEKYGTVYQVRSFGTMGLKAAFKRAAKALGYEPAQAAELSKLLAGSLDIIRDDHPKLAELTEHFMGVVQNYTVHASAVLVFSEDPSQFCALERTVDSQTKEVHYVASFDFHDLEDMGLLKQDILGLKTCDVIINTVQAVHMKEDIDQLPPADAKTIALLRSGQTAGVFQLESNGMTNLVKRMMPANVYDLVPLVALFRPGPLDSGMVEEFLTNRQRKACPVVHPSLEPILADTYGVIVYQEQIMAIVRALAGYSLGEADMLRRIIGRKKAELIDEAMATFKAKGIANGIDAAIMDEMVRQIITFANYGFNKSHSAAYGIIAYQTAYLKAHYPLEFMCALINSEGNNQEKTLPYIAECKRMGIKVLPPDIKKSKNRWIIEDGCLRMGLSYVKYVGDVEGIKQLPKRARESLIKAGAMDAFGTRAGMLTAVYQYAEKIAGYQEKIHQTLDKINQIEIQCQKTSPTTKKYEQLVAQLANRRQDLAKYQDKLFATEDALADIAAYDEAQGETEVLGFSFQDKLARYDLTRCEAYQKSPVERIIGGECTKWKPWTTKKGAPMAFVTVNTPAGEAELAVFDRVLRRCGTMAEGAVYLISVLNGVITDWGCAKLLTEN